MRRGIPRGHTPVVVLGDDLSMEDEHGTNRNLLGFGTFTGLFQRYFHKVAVIGFSHSVAQSLEDREKYPHDSVVVKNRHVGGCH